MAFEKPQFRIDIQFGNNLAFIEFATVFGDADDTVKHQHWR